MNLNLHQLELFYYAARHGGLTQATARMPYGLDPSTLSRQLCELERQTGLPLYVRRVFKLTPAGENLYAFIKPLFEDLPALIQGWRKGLPESVRLGASPVVLREYLPPVLTTLQKNFPGLQLGCHEASQPQIEVLLKEKSIDLAIMILEGTLPAGYESELIARLPLVLLVPEKSKLRGATELWRRESIAETLVSLPQDNPITQYFQKGLRRRKIDWKLGLAANSIDLVETYVKEGLGIGVSLALPGRLLTGRGLRALPLADFPNVPVGLVWRCKPKPALEALIQELRRIATQLTKPRQEKA